MDEESEFRSTHLLCEEYIRSMFVDLCTANGSTDDKFKLAISDRELLFEKGIKAFMVYVDRYYNGSMRDVTYQVLSYYAYRQNEILEFIETKDNIIKLIAQKEASKTRDEIDEISIKIYQFKYDFVEQMLEIYKHL